jgi:hypothetical protein
MKLVLAAGLLLCGGTAFAQVEDPSAPPSGDPAVVAPPPVELVGWSDAIIDRPLTMPKGKIGVYGDLDILRLSSSTTVGGVSMTSVVTAEGLGIGGGYGIDDKLEVGAEYSFSLNSFEIKGPLSLYGSYAVFQKGKLTIGASGALIIDLNGGTTVDPVTGASSTNVNLALIAGVGARYKLTDKIAVYTGNPIAPGILGSQIHIGLNNSGAVGIDLPVGAAIQATPQLYAWVQTNLAHIKIANDSNSLIFSDFIPVEIGALFAAVPHKVDVGAALDIPDLEHRPGDALVFSLLGRLYL